MNSINQLTIDYITPSRTIETIQLSNGTNNFICYIYNYEGVHYRLFNTVLELVAYFECGKEPEISFDNEVGIDEYILNKIVYFN